MARVEGISPQQASFLMRQVFKKVRTNDGLAISRRKKLQLGAESVLGALVLDVYGRKPMI